jgi:hypothetical protein
MEDSPEYHFKLLKRILNYDKEPVELYSIQDLPRMNLRSSHRKILDIIIEKNTMGVAPLYRDLMDITRGDIYKALSQLRKKELVATPNIMQIGYLLHTRTGGKICFQSCPKNIVFYLKSYCRSKNTWSNRFKRIHNKNWPKATLALFHDNGHPVYKDCFKNMELPFLPKKL